MEQSIEEYKSIRAEILRNFEAKERNLIACITANGVALAIGLKENQPLVIFLALFIPIYFWIQDIHYRNDIAKLGSYIATFLEGSESKLMWENRVRKIDSEIIEQHLPYFLLFLKTYLHPYPIILAFSIIIIAVRHAN